MEQFSLPVIPTQSRSGVVEERTRLAAELARRIEGEVRFERHDRMLYSTDASIYQVEPIGVVVLRTLRDAEIAIAFAAEHGLPLLPRGGGTSLAGQTVNLALVIDFSAHCRGLIHVDPEARRARVEPGIVLDDLNQQLAPHQLMFGPDVATSSHATLGGMIGNNSAGAHSILYGRTVEHLLGLEVVLADGERLQLEEAAAERDPRVRALTEQVAAVTRGLADEITARFPRTRRRVDGYNLDLMLEQLRASTPGTFDRINLAHLFCGSEGTLGVTLEATLGLVESPRQRGLAIIAFPGVDEALEAVLAILESKPAAVELIDDVIIRLAQKNLEHRRYVELLPRVNDQTPDAVLYVEYFRDNEEDIAARFAHLASQFGSDRMRTYRAAAEMSAAWRLRKAGEPLLHGGADPHGRKPITFIEDTAVEPARLPEFIRQFRALVTRHGTTASYYAHASVGCLHVRPMICLADPDDEQTMQQIAAEATDLVVAFGGALSGEHGDGRLRSHLLERYFGKALCDGFRTIKAIFDPQNRMNPGNIVAPLPMTEHLRIRPANQTLRVPEVETFYHYEREHGFGSAVEMCNGAGVCRRLKGGTMCPSYRATLDERHATRGRGNALRLAITGQLGDEKRPQWNDPETLATLDLCLSCKACKSECPSNVDIAKLKAEYLAQTYRARGGPPWRTRVFGRVRSINQLGSMTPRLSNAFIRAPGIGAMMKRAMGIDARRSLPPFARSLYGWDKRRPRPNDEFKRPSVILYPDCFTVYSEPEIGRAAILTLERLGYRVVLPCVGCCGRAMISTGMLDDAIETCSQTASSLRRVISEVNPRAIVGCEPSCVSALTDDWQDLKLTAPREDVQLIGGLTMLVEDFLLAEWEHHPQPFDMMNTPSPEPLLLHGHCHQKALWGAEQTIELLRRCGYENATLLDTGCCGMAGAFGFSRDHFDLSIRIGELDLFPQLRAAPDARIAAPGTSCRHQIRDALSRSSKHPIEFIAEALGSLPV